MFVGSAVGLVPAKTLIETLGRCLVGLWTSLGVSCASLEDIEESLGILRVPGGCLGISGVLGDSLGAPLHPEGRFGASWVIFGRSRRTLARLCEVLGAVLP